MSKLYKTEERARATVAQYEEDWVNGKSEYVTMDYYKSKDGKHWIVYNRSTGEAPIVLTLIACLMLSY